MCLKCEDATSVGACNDNSAASQQLCEGNEDTCWFRITYEKDGTEKNSQCWLQSLPSLQRCSRTKS